MANVTIEITRKQNAMVRKQIEGHCKALKNWIASAVENNDFDRAKAMTIELRDHEDMYHLFVPDSMWQGD